MPVFGKCKVCGYEETVDYNCIVCMNVRIDQLERALEQAIAEVREHQLEYHHVTPKEMIDGWVNLLVE